MKSLNKKLLTIGCLQTLAMAAYHFFLPFQYQWAQFLGDLPTINWALYGLNNYFSFNLLVLSITLLYHIKYKINKLYTIKILSLVVVLFWVFSVVYQLTNPMPLPQNMKWLGFLLPAIAFLNVILFVIPIRKLLVKN